jgi:phosphatidylglycerophosphatase A
MTTKQPEPGKRDGHVREVLTDPVHFLAFGFGAGLLPAAPGTWASLFTAVGFWFLPDMPLWLYGGLIGIMFLLGVWICGESARRLGIHDFGGIVFDEIVGMFATLMVLPVAGVAHDPVWIMAAFLCFRAADIWKPWPIRDVDHSLTGGLGIMLDDLLAAIYAALITFLMLFLFTVV